MNRLSRYLFYVFSVITLAACGVAQKNQAAAPIVLSPRKIETTTLVLTAHDRDAYLSSMMEAGAAGYLDKKLRAGQLISSIRRAARGEILFDKKQIERARRWREKVSRKWDSLSKREREALQMLTEGADNKAMAVSLGITINTVEKHLANIYRKLEVTSRAEVIHWWVEKGTDFRN